MGRKRLHAQLSGLMCAACRRVFGLGDGLLTVTRERLGGNTRQHAELRLLSDSTHYVRWGFTRASRRTRSAPPRVGCCAVVYGDGRSGIGGQGRAVCSAWADRPLYERGGLATFRENQKKTQRTSYTWSLTQSCYEEPKTYRVTDTPR